ncbi:glycosyltransferase [Antarcticibacterium sp. 1MA-6-2]|uniref:glycosyltransferase n=1 Tax=Antarcticibacterium sp. 1MA-6-2 TaxID=2908210 RepID=UPI001F21CA90|nr:glycosyltransferase [Antarcticibacterium sp. 1MA-6-2]UJH91328.1 glycosyltransferase [Antarcticibacterium sp. 1MA-6-2]
MVARKLKRIFPDIPLVGSLVSNSYGKQRYLEMSFLSQLKLFTTQCRDRFSTSKVDYFICNSKAIKKTNVKALGIPEEKVKVIYRGRSFKDYKISSENVERIRKELNPGNKKIFLNVGRLIRSKGQLDLLQAFKILLEQYPENQLYIAGEGPLRAELEKKIAFYNLQNNVHLLGYREDIPELLAVTDFFVFPSYFEGLPGALLEAIIAKKPTIVSDIPENRECFMKNGALFFHLVILKPWRIK